MTEELTIGVTVGHAAPGQRGILLRGRSRVAVPHESGVEIPSDLAGLIYIPLDPAGAWRLDLLKELEGAEIEVNRARMPRCRPRGQS